MSAFAPIPYTVLSALLGGIVTLCIAYLLTLLLAADRALKRRQDAAGGIPPVLPRITVVIPAHDEETVLEATLESLAGQDYPVDRFEVVVVADNCSDATAAIARARGARVFERREPRLRGKGYALDWAFQRLLAAPDPTEAFVIVDADTFVDHGFLRTMTGRLATGQDVRGRCALQGRYGVLNRGEGWRAALMDGAFELHNHVKLLGSERLGLSVGLKGNGMAFTRAVLEQARWRGSSVTEDIDYGLDLLCDHGVRVGYVPEARVLAQMPVTAAQAASQRARWEEGRSRLLRARCLALLSAGLRRRDGRLCAAVADLAAPPLAELAGLLLLWGALIALGHAAGWLAGWWYGAWSGGALGLAAYVLGGLRVAGAPRAAYLALLRGPAYAAWKFALYASRLLRGRAEATAPEWVRTARRPIAGKIEP